MSNPEALDNLLREWPELADPAVVGTPNLTEGQQETLLVALLEAAEQSQGAGQQPSLAVQPEVADRAVRAHPMASAKRAAFGSRLAASPLEPLGASIIAGLIWSLFFGLTHLSIYLAAAVLQVAAALLHFARGRVVIGRILILMASFAEVDFLSYHRFRGPEGLQALGLSNIDQIQFPGWLVFFDLLAYGILFEFIRRVAVVARSVGEARQRATHGAMRTVGCFGLIAVIYWLLIWVGITSNWAHFDTVNDLVRGVWDSDIVFMTIQVWALYGITAAVAFALPRWDRLGYPKVVAWFARKVLRVESTETVPLGDLARWLTVPVLFYIGLGPWLTPAWDSWVVRIIAVSVAVGVGFLSRSRTEAAQ